MPYGYDNMYNSLDCICTECGSINSYFIKNSVPPKYKIIYAYYLNCNNKVKSIFLGDANIIKSELNFKDENDLTDIQLQVKTLIKKTKGKSK